MSFFPASGRLLIWTYLSFTLIMGDEEYAIKVSCDPLGPGTLTRRIFNSNEASRRKDRPRWTYLIYRESFFFVMPNSIHDGLQSLWWFGLCLDSTHDMELGKMALKRKHPVNSYWRNGFELGVGFVTQWALYCTKRVLTLRGLELNLPMWTRMRFVRLTAMRSIWIEGKRWCNDMLRL